MGKSKKGWKNIEDAERDDSVLDVGKDKSIQTIANESLFFVDAKGNLGGMEDLRRKKKRGLSEAAEPSAKEQKMSIASSTTISTAISSSSVPSSAASSVVVAQDEDSQPTKMDVSGPGKPKWKRRQESGLRVVTKAANKQDDKERRQNLALAGMAFDPNLVITDLWAEEQNPEKGVLLEKARNKGFEVDPTPLEIRKRKYLRPRTKKQVEMSRELVDSKGVDAPSSGISFNPDEDERQKALLPAYLRDEKERKEATELKEKLNPKPNIVENALPEEDDESELFPHKKQAKQKTKVQKNAKSRQIREAYEKQQEKQQKNIIKQIDRLGNVLAEVKKEEKKMKLRKAQLDKLKENPDRRPKTSKHEFEAPFPEVPLEDELTKDRSMRTMTPSATLMRDQFKRFQEKNIIEPRKRITGRKQRHRMKAHTRKSHKDPNDAFPCKASKT